MAPRKPSARAGNGKPQQRPQPPKPETFIYTHKPSPERLRSTILQMLMDLPLMQTVLHETKQVIRNRFGRLEWIAECPVDRTHVHEENEPGLIICSDHIQCSAGGHKIDARTVLLYLSDGDNQKLDEILSHFSLPDPIRCYCFETESGRREVGSDPLETLAALGAPPDKPVRGCVIQCESLNLAKQLAGQLKDKLPWNENIPRTATGRLRTVTWHRGWLTNRERLLEGQLSELNMLEGKREAKRQLDKLKRDLRLQNC